MAKADPLARYKAKRNFEITSEPAEGGSTSSGNPMFVIQKHWARRLHYDFRLEIDGTMKSWAIPKGPSLDPTDKRMAVHVEDHPVSYNEFEGEIPAGQYGAGKVIIWDKGSWTAHGNPRAGYRAGKLVFELHGHKLQGTWALVRMRGKSGKTDPWLLIKEKDDHARSKREFSIVDEQPDSVAAFAPAPPAGDGRHTSATPSRRGTPRAALPAKLKPQLATLVDKPPSDSENWLYEVKFDGYRLLARMHKGSARLYTRNGNDWTGKLDDLCRALAGMKLPDGWYDGEIIVPDSQGLPDFQALQAAFDKAASDAVIYYLFDLPYFDGKDLRQLSLLERRQQLEAVLQSRSAATNTVRFSAAFDVPARDIYASACRIGLEGIIGKKKTATYQSRRTLDWIKLKCSLRQEFVIGGFTDPQGTREGIGSLLLGVHDELGRLRYAGNVGTGFDTDSLRAIRQQLDALASPDSPFSGSTGSYRKAHWVKPALLAEVSFAQWTRDGRIRHSVFHGLRSDKPAKAIVRETSMSVSSKQSGSKQHDSQPHSLLGKLKITHPERIVDETTGVTKIEVVRYYALVGSLMLPHLKHRPVSLVRAPEGVRGQMFFQKHMDASGMTGVRALPARLDPGHEPLLEIASPQGLLSAAQMNVLELHTWNAVKTNIGKPDRLIFDLDPGKGVEWPAIQEAALVLRAFLEQLELVSFVKTSGGKGLHVVVPIQRRYDWETVKGFSQAVVQHMAKTLPRRFSAKSGPRNRVGKLFIDYLRNGFGATTVSAWSLRGRPGMGVSVPIRWAEVEKISSSAHWHIRNIHERLDTGNDPWDDYASSARTLASGMKSLGYKTPDKP